MTSIERTAYPRLKRRPSAQELADVYTPTIDDLAFIRATARGPLVHPDADRAAQGVPASRPPATVAGRAVRCRHPRAVEPAAPVGYGARRHPTHAVSAPRADPHTSSGEELGRRGASCNDRGGAPGRPGDGPP